jgi:hypothetical protein
VPVASLPGLPGREKRPDGLEPVGRDDAPGHEIPEAFFDFDRETPRCFAKLRMEHGAVLPERVEHIAAGTVGRFGGGGVTTRPLEEPGQVLTQSEGDRSGP